MMRELGLLLCVVGGVTACGSVKPPSDTTGETDATTVPSETEDYAECEPPDGVTSVEFTVSIDGVMVEIDYSDWDSPQPVLPEGWNNWDGMPEIDGPCGVSGFVPEQGLLSLSCADVMGVDRSVELSFSSSTALAPTFEGDQVQLHYVVQYSRDELEANADTAGHSFVLSTNEGLALAGIDGRFSTYGSITYAWPDSLLTIDSAEGLCPEQDEGWCEFRGRSRLTVETSTGDSASSFDGNAVPLGALVLVVDTALEQRFLDSGSDDCCCGEQLGETVASVLLGPPA